MCGLSSSLSAATTFLPLETSSSLLAATVAATSGAELRFGTATSLFSSGMPEEPSLAFGGAAELWWFSMAGRVVEDLATKRGGV